MLRLFLMLHMHAQQGSLRAMKMPDVNPLLRPQDVVAQQSERFFVAEILREKIFLQFAQEVPYCTAVSTRLI